MMKRKKKSFITSQRKKKGDYRRMKKKELLKLWPLKYESKRWTLIYFLLKPAKLKIEKIGEQKHSAADFAQKVMELKKKLPNKDFSITVEPPFVVCGDSGSRKVKAYSDGTVAWAVKMLEK